MRTVLIVGALVCNATLSYPDSSPGSAAGQFDDHRIPMVFDAQGKTVGPLVSASGVSGVFITINGAFTFVPIIHSARNYTNGRLEAERSSSQYQWSDSSAVAYASSDCSGTPLILQIGNSEDVSVGRPSTAIRNGADVTVYVASDTYSSLNAAGSILSLNNGAPGSCIPQGPGTLAAPTWPAESAYPITQHYPEPLKVGYGDR
ncbi:hypothetical protein [Paraburkholderia phosphatilytica]|uniref:hypothetical protein n=1 Tax=Paraburkholderia phosphatilytica TaxID=2282883 RepID=UPI000E4BB0A4|nr:hypothetical protein [Paraburkholderia phosphatilytica]